MHSLASNSGRNRAPSLKGLLAMMAGFFIVFIILAELANATTNNQPATSPAAEPSVVATPDVEAAPAPAEAVAEPTATPIKFPRSLSYGASEIIKMFKGGVKADVLFSYIETANLSYQLSSKEILYLSQIGVPSEIVTAMIRHDHQMALAQLNAQQPQAPVATEQPTTSPVVYSQPVVVVQQQPKVKYVSTPVCSTPACPTVSQPSPNVTIIGSRYGSTFNNGCYYGPFSYSPARAYFNCEFGPRCGYSSYYDFGYRDRFAYNGYGYGGYGNGHHRWGRY
jgi:hypothetical protein